MLCPQDISMVYNDDHAGPEKKRNKTNSSVLKKELTDMELVRGPKPFSCLASSQGCKV